MVCGFTGQSRIPMAYGGGQDSYSVVTVRVYVSNSFNNNNYWSIVDVRINTW